MCRSAAPRASRIRRSKSVRTFSCPPSRWRPTRSPRRVSSRTTRPRASPSSRRAARSSADGSSRTFRTSIPFSIPASLCGSPEAFRRTFNACPWRRQFKVVIAGRPNVGKSALFNRLLGRRRSLVHDLPGMTRDVLEVEARLPDERIYRLVDTGGFDPEGREPIPKAVREKALAAIRGADLVVLVMDASAGVLPGDRAAARAAREAGADTIVVANKIDRKEGSEGEVEAWELGFPEVYGVSAEHAVGVDDIQTAIAARMSASSSEGIQRKGRRTGRRTVPRRSRWPSSGAPTSGNPRSSTRSWAGAGDRVGDHRERRATPWTRCSSTRAGASASWTRPASAASHARSGGRKSFRSSQARKRIEESDVVLLVLDANEGVAAQDSAVASAAYETGKGLVLIGNKWDLAGRPGEEAAKEFAATVEERLPFAGSCADPPRVGADRTRDFPRARYRGQGGREPAPPHHDGGAEPRARPPAARQAAADRLGQEAQGLLRRADRCPRRRPSPWSPTAPRRSISPRPAASRTSSERPRTSAAARSGSPSAAGLRRRSPRSKVQGPNPGRSHDVGHTPSILTIKSDDSLKSSLSALSWRSPSLFCTGLFTVVLPIQSSR